WQISAAYVEDRQLRSIHDGALQVLSRPGTNVQSIVTAGIGASAAHRVADRLALPSVTFAELIECEETQKLWATRCAPAVAVALLLDK
ncbi:MAG: hypothetical protein ABWX70_02905, partial [Hyphomicrobium sp.]